MIMLRDSVLTVPLWCLAVASASIVPGLDGQTNSSGMKLLGSEQMGANADTLSVLPGFVGEYTRGNSSLVFDLQDNYPTLLSISRSEKRGWVAILPKIWIRNPITNPTEDTTHYKSPPNSSPSSPIHQTLLHHLTHYLTTTYTLLTTPFTSTTPNSLPLTILYITYLYLCGTLFFDLAHYALHQFSKSRSRLLRRVGYLHQVHHLYFNRSLRFNPRYRALNTLCELPLELGCQLVGTVGGYVVLRVLGWLLLGAGAGAGAGERLGEEWDWAWQVAKWVLRAEIVRSVIVAAWEGMDSNHLTYEGTVPRDRAWCFVGPEFHALHHVYPEAYLGSWVRVFDWIAGSAWSGRGRRVGVVVGCGFESGCGDGSAFTEILNRNLESEKIACCTLLDGRSTAASENSVGRKGQVGSSVLIDTDILILTGMPLSSQEAATTIEHFKRHRKPKRGSRLLPEVWYFSDEDEESAAEERLSTRRLVRRYFEDEEVVFRYVVGGGGSREEIESEGERTNRVEKDVMNALWWIKRGARYVPPNCGWDALCGWLRFFYGPDCE